MSRRLAKVIDGLRQIPSLVAQMKQARAEPIIYRLLCAKEGKACLEVVDASDSYTRASLNHARQSVLFIHGAEYRDAGEVMRDLVFPFFSSAQIPESEIHQNFNVYMLCWNSSLLCRIGHSQIAQLLCSLSRPMGYLLLANYWSKFYEDVEQRALEAADFILPFVYGTFAKDREDRLVVTHSMGAFVWANVIKNLQMQDRLPSYLGTWWSTQSALPHDAFSPEGAFHMVPVVYEITKSKYELWYSRFDVVLGCFYFAVKKRWAQGQVGCTRVDFGEQFDLSNIAREAHGAVALLPGHGDFWQRIGDFLRTRMAIRLAAFPSLN